MNDNPNPLPNPRRSPDSEPPLPAWMILPGSLVQPSAPALEDVEASEDDTPGGTVAGAAPEGGAGVADDAASERTSGVADGAAAEDAKGVADGAVSEDEADGAASADMPGASGGTASREAASVERGATSADVRGASGGADAGDDGVGATDAGDEPQKSDGGPTLEAALEAILLIVDEPVAEVTLAQVLERPTHEVAAALRGLAAEYTAAGRGFDLREVAGGWRFYTRSDCAPLVERFVRDGQQTRLTQAALETLAVVAYRQPVSRARVAAVRGVNSDGVMRTLVARGLVEEAGTDPESQAMLYRTTSYFLERLGLRDLSELPELAPLLPDDVENLEETTK